MDRNYTYILRCADGTLYCGWTNDLEKRVAAHNAGTAAKYMRPRRPVELVYYEAFGTKREAMSREARIKRMNRQEKLSLIETRRRAMWKCPKCGREFAKENQGHYCVKPKSVDEYIAMQEETAQPYLRDIRAAIHDAIPDAVEKISWSMPTFWKGCNLIQFAASKKHIGLYPGPEAVEAFAERLGGYEMSKGTIRLPYDKPLPLGMIADMAKWCLKKYGK